MLSAFRLLARFRRLRGSAFDIFGYTPERRAERRLIAEFEAILDEITATLTPQNHAAALALAGLPLEIRGFGHVKEASLARAKLKQAQLLAQYRSPTPAAALAAAE
jgi:indolepyruvate ferredoxin oxidoreductase